MGNERVGDKDEGRDEDDDYGDEKTKAPPFPIKRRYIAPISCYKIFYVTTSIAAPLIFTLISTIPSNCKTAP